MRILQGWVRAILSTYKTETASASRSAVFILRNAAKKNPLGPGAASILFSRSRTAPILLALSFFLTACARSSAPAPGTVTFLIESMPGSLDPRIGTDVQSERLHSLLFSGLVERDPQMKIRGDLAETWETPDPLTYIFHLRRGVQFHDGRPLTSADVKFTFDSILSNAISTPKRSSFRMVKQIDAPDPATVIFHLSEPYASFLWNLARPAMGIVPQGAGAD
ncbi:MAG TPA: ABC transporter substrate-binding protein, partial [Candidatus Acidoferrales bacterium]